MSVNDHHDVTQMTASLENNNRIINLNSYIFNYVCERSSRCYVNDGIMGKQQ